MAKHWLREDYGFKADWWYDQKSSSRKTQVRYSQLNQMKQSYAKPTNLQYLQMRKIELKNAPYKIAINNIKQYIQTFNGLGLNGNDFFEAFNKVLNNIDNIKSLSGRLKAGAIGQYTNNLQVFIDAIKKTSRSEVVPPAVLQSYTKMINALQKSEKNFHREKGAFWEEIGTWVLEMSGLRAITSANFIDPLGKKIIQDGIIEPLGGIGITSVKTKLAGTKSQRSNLNLKKALEDALPNKTYKVDFVKGGKGYIEISAQSGLSLYSLQNFCLQPLQSILGSSIILQIDDETKKKLDDAMTVQTKSGIGQSLLNQSKRDWITIILLREWDKYINLLSQFANTYRNADSVKFGQSDRLAAYINWVFSNNIMKTTLGKNTIFFTFRGFQTLDEILKSETSYFRLQSDQSNELDPKYITHLITLNGYRRIRYRAALTRLS